MQGEFKEAIERDSNQFFEDVIVTGEEDEG